MFEPVEDNIRKRLRFDESLRTPPVFFQKMMEGAGELMASSNVVAIKNEPYYKRPGLVGQKSAGAEKELVDPNASVYQCAKCKQLFFSFETKNPGEYEDSKRTSGVIPLSDRKTEEKAVCLHCLFNDSVNSIILSQAYSDLKKDHQIDDAHLALFYGYLVYCPEGTQHELNHGQGEFIRTCLRLTEQLALEALGESKKIDNPNNLHYPGRNMPAPAMKKFFTDFLLNEPTDWMDSDSHDVVSESVKKALKTVSPEFTDWNKKRPQCADYLKDMVFEVAYNDSENRQCYYSESLTALGSMDQDLRHSVISQKSLKWMLPSPFISQFYITTSYFF